MKSLKQLLPSICLFLIAQSLFAQNYVGKTRLVLTSNDTLIVKILDVNKTTYIVENVKNGRTIKVPRTEISSMETIKKLDIEATNGTSKKMKLLEAKIVEEEIVEAFVHDRIITHQGDTITGNIIAKGTETITIMHPETEKKERIALQNIKKMDKINIKVTKIVTNTEGGVYSSKYYRHATRNNYTTTAFPLSKGEGYYQNIMLGYNSVHYGITNHFSLGTGFQFLTVLLDRDAIYWGIHAKYAGAVAPNAHLGVSVFHVTPLKQNISYTGIIGATTHGDRVHNVTFGLGYIRTHYSSRYSSFDTGSVLGHLSAQAHITKNCFFVSDLIGLIGKDVSGILLNPGIQIKSKKMSFDVNLMLLGVSDYGFLPIPIPTIGFTRCFWQKKLQNFGE
jgi:hypothetical protein